MAAPSRLYPLRPHADGEALSAETRRFVVVPAGRRSGKTERAKRKLVVESLVAQGWDDPRFFAGAPTRDQAKQIFWGDLKAMLPPSLVRKTWESELIVQLTNGAELCVVGMDKPQRIEGRSWNGGVLDEFANMKPGAWSENVRPALSDRRGWCWLIGVPEGRNHYWDLWRRASASKLNGVERDGGDPDWAACTWHSAAVLPPDEVASARRDLDPLTYQQEYEASFVNFEGRAYYPFLEATHCAPLAKLYDPRADLALCFDFNVSPGVAVVCQEVAALPGQYERDPATRAPLLSRPLGGTAVLGEVHIPRNSNTPAVCRRIVKDWGSHSGRVTCYGDASGGADGSAKVAGSDWDLIRKELGAVYGERLSFKVRTANPAERARVNAVNTRLLNGTGEARMLVDAAKAPYTVRDLEGVVTLKGGSGEIDKKANPELTHLSDALGYYVEREFPVRGNAAAVSGLRA